MMKTFRASGLITILVLAAMLVGAFTLSAKAASAVSFTFTDSGITVSGASEGYEIDGTALKITASGTYTITGSCTDGSITVKKGVTDVTLVLNDLTLSSSTGAPLCCNKSTEVTLSLSGTSTLTDAEDPDDEDSTDEAVADAFEGAVIKVKSGASLTITGTGTLNADGSNCKNGVKGAASATITVESGTLNITAAKNGLACDNAVIINGGKLNITAGNDAIKAEPDEDDADSKGTITINGGEITINATGDGVQATGLLTITGGSIDVTTFGGYTKAANLGDDSAKGLKSDAGVVISGGTFTLNCADDAVHSDADVTITGGTFTIQSGDDAIHSDYVTTLGTEGGSSGPSITVKNSYEGVEGGKVYLHSGTGSITASDDGVNAANDAENYQMAITITGGNWTINAGGDGLDAGGDSRNNSGGDIIITGGVTEVYGAADNGNSALDFDGSMTYSGGTLLAVGMNGMAQTPTSGTYVVFGQSGMGGGFFGGFFGGNTGSSSVNLKSGDSISISDSSGNVLYTATAVKNANHVVFMSDKITSGESYTLQVNGSTAATATASTGSGQSGMQPGGDSSQGGNHPGQGGTQPPSGEPGQGGMTPPSGDPNQGGTIPPTGDPNQGGATPPTENPNSGDSQQTALPFSDVKTSDWFYSAVQYAYENGVMSGMGDGTFSPNTNLTRAQMVQILYNIEGKPAVTGVSFSDVSSGDWYANAVAWAQQNSIVTGYDASTFGPNDSLTRAQAATILMRYAKYKGMDVSEATSLTFTDAANVPDWASDAMQWCAAKGYLQGDENHQLLPNGTATRAQIATIMQRFLTK